MEKDTQTAIGIYLGIIGLISFILSLFYAGYIIDTYRPRNSLKRRVAKWYLIGATVTAVLVGLWFMSYYIAIGSPV
jgi:hypothetical protein